MASIKVTPETLKTQGESLVTHGESLADILKEVDTLINTICEEWDGLAQDAYFDMYTNMKESLDQFPQLVDALGKATQSAADAFASVDEQLRDSFK